jgi:hypothetical protein
VVIVIGETKRIKSHYRVSQNIIDALQTEKEMKKTRIPQISLRVLDDTFCTVFVI